MILTPFQDYQKHLMSFVPIELLVPIVMEVQISILTGYLPNHIPHSKYNWEQLWWIQRLTILKQYRWKLSYVRI